VDRECHLPLGQLKPPPQSGHSGEYVALEPNAWDNESLPPCPRCGSIMKIPTSGDKLAGMATGFVLAGGIGAILAVSRRKYRCPQCSLGV
jgi:ribosomal protein S27AE